MIIKETEASDLFNYVREQNIPLVGYIESLRQPMDLIDQVCEGEEIPFRLTLLRRFVLTYGYAPDRSRSAPRERKLAELFGTDPDSITKDLQRGRKDPCLSYAWDKVIELFDPHGKRIT